MTPFLDLALVHFRAVDLRYFEAAWYSISKQDLSRVQRVIVYDNDTDDDSDAIEDIIAERPVAVPVRYVFDKHRNPQRRSQSYSVNAAVRACSAPWVLFTRTDYILDFSLVAKFVDIIEQRSQVMSEWVTANLGEAVEPLIPIPWHGFVTSYAYHMAYDERADQRIVGMRDIEPTGWREQGPQVLLDTVNGWKVDSSDRDAGVWATTRWLFEQAGGLNEQLQAWGLQQTVFQQRLFELQAQIIQIPEFLFFHQHHGGEFRDYDKAVAELEQHWGPRENLRTFRDISNFIGKVNDETPRS